MSIAVTITKDDQGSFSISVDQDKTPDQDAAPSTDATMGSAPGAEPMGDTDAAQDAQEPNKTPVKDLNQALQLASKILSQPDQAGQSPFDQGVASTLPQKG